MDSAVISLAITEAHVSALAATSSYADLPKSSPKDALVNYPSDWPAGLYNVNEIEVRVFLIKISLHFK